MSRFLQHPHRRSLHRCAFAVATIAIGLFASAATATILPVGPGGGTCTYSSIQAAINAAASGDSITVADAGANYNEKLTITDKSLSISSCPCNHQVCLFDTTHNGLTNVTISGAGGANAPVLKIVTTNASNPVTVNLDRVTIQDGHSGSIDGGGISFSGVGALNLVRTTVTGNTANYGAGINFKANGGDATLTINHDTFITYNTAATSGGGIRVEGGGATLNVNDKSTWIANNQATAGLGGGIEVINDAHAYIGSPGYLFGGVIYENAATNGGGIALSGAGVYLYLYTSDAQHPVTIDNNTAYSIGGGIYLNGAKLCAQNPRFTNNIAQDGTAIYGEGDSRAIINSDYYYTSTPSYAGEYGQYCGANAPVAAACDPSTGCNTVQGHIAEAVKNGNAATAGSTFSVHTLSVLAATGIDVRGNQGGHVLNVAGSNLTTLGLFYNSLIADNAVSQELLFAGGGYTQLTLDNCTVTHNTNDAANVIVANDGVYLNLNIIDSPLPAIAYSGSNMSETYNLAGNLGDLTQSTDMQGSPTFVDAAHGDYRLFYGIKNGNLVQSLGIDYAPPITGDDRDVRGQPRDQAIVTPRFGDRDLGAYEMQGVGDRIFIGTFGDDVLLVQ